MDPYLVTNLEAVVPSLRILLRELDATSTWSLHVAGVKGNAPTSKKDRVWHRSAATLNADMEFLLPEHRKSADRGFATGTSGADRYRTSNNVSFREKPRLHRVQINV